MRKRAGSIGIAALALFAASAGLTAAQDKPGQIGAAQVHDLMEEISAAFEAASDKVSAFVVPIFAEQVVQTPAQGFPDDPFRDFFCDEFFMRFFGAPPQAQKRTVHSLGSGVIVSRDGHILTNNHVVAGANKLTIILGDNRKFEATIVGTDPQTDLAVIKIGAQTL